MTHEHRVRQAADVLRAELAAASASMNGMGSYKSSMHVKTAVMKSINEAESGILMLYDIQGLKHESLSDA